MLLGGALSLFIINYKEKDLLEKEILAFQDKDLSRDDFTVKVKTKKSYAYIEETIKKYYKDLSDNIKSINYYLSNNNFIEILSIEQLKKDRPNYTFSHVTVKSTKSKINKALENIDNLCSEENIKNLIDKKKFHDYDRKYFSDLFLDTIYSNGEAIKLDNTKEEMDRLSKDLNTFLDKIDKVLTFLHDNDDDLELSSTKGIIFEDEDISNSYKKLYNELQEIAGNFEKASEEDTL